MNKTESQNLNMNNSSNEWFKPVIDRKIIKELAKRSDLAGWQHIIIYIFSLFSLGLLCTFSWGTWWFILSYIAYCTLTIFLSQ